MVGDDVTTKEYLSQIAVLDNIIKTKEKELKTKWSRITSTTSPPDKEPIQGGAGVSDKVGNGVPELIELQNDIAMFKKDRAERIRLIETINHPLDFDILYDHYVYGISLVEFANRKNFSYQYIVERHVKALKRLKIPKKPMNYL